MLVMPSNNAKWQVHFWQGLYGGLGHLYAPVGPCPDYGHLPYACDNGAYPAFSNGHEWDSVQWKAFLERIAAKEQKPLWILAPDCVGNRIQTLEMYKRHFETIRELFPDIPIAFAVQDGMVHDDVPDSADVVFVGGTTDWKWRSLRYWSCYERVHVGRVNGYKGLRICADLGVESCDGTGWFRGDKEQLAGLQRFLQEQSGTHEKKDIILGQTKRK